MRYLLAKRRLCLLGQRTQQRVLNRPGAMVTTRINSRDRSRAIGSVIPTTPPLDAE